MKNVELLSGVRTVREVDFFQSWRDDQNDSMVSVQRTVDSVGQ